MADPDDIAAFPITPGDVSEAAMQAYSRLSNHAAKGVAVISVRHGGWDYAVTVTDFLSVSYDPPTMLVSLYSLSRMADAVEASDRFALSILSAKQTAVADWLGEPGSPLVSLLDPVQHFHREDASPALVTDALAWFELRKTAAYQAATHTLIVGEVSWMGQPTGRGAAPLVRYQSGYNQF